MPSLRFVPDLFTQFVALLTFYLLLRRGWMPFLALRILGVALSVLWIAGFFISALQAAGYEAGFRWEAVSGLSFACATAFLGAVAIWFLLNGANRKLISPPVAQRRKLLTVVTGVAMAAPAAILTAGFVVGRKQFHVEEVELALPDLAPDLEGLRIVQLSDIHLSPFLSRSELARCVDMANETRAQIAVVTGDLITGLHDPIDDCLDELKRLRADSGVYGCMGNHEAYIQAETYVQQEANRRGIQFLRHERCELQFGSAKLNLAGVDHQWKKQAYLSGADHLIVPGHFNLLLSHNPATFPKAAAQGWDLTLAGHMHGGQINVELMHANLNFMRLSTPYVYGIYRQGRSAIYVTRGIGTVAMPVRFGAPPEVALIRLRKA